MKIFSNFGHRLLMAFGAMIFGSTPLIMLNQVGMLPQSFIDNFLLTWCGALFIGGYLFPNFGQKISIIGVYTTRAPAGLLNRPDPNKVISKWWLLVVLCAVAFIIFLISKFN